MLRRLRLSPRNQISCSTFLSLPRVIPGPRPALLCLAAACFGLGVPASAELVGLWRFDADLTVQPDLSTNGNHATVVSAVWTNDTERGGAMWFDGANDYLQAADSESLSILGDMTIALWVRRISTVGFRGLVGKTRGNLPAPYDLYLQGAAGNPRFLRGNGFSWGGPLSTGTVRVAEWDHVAASMEDTNISFYVNGDPAGEAGLTGITIGDDNRSLRIGNRDDLGTDFLGSLDDVAIFNEPLSPDQVQAVMGGDFREFGIFESLSLFVSASAQPALGAHSLTYTISVANAESTPATNVVVRDVLPDCVAFLSATSTVGSCKGNNSLPAGPHQHFVSTQDDRIARVLQVRTLRLVSDS